MCFPNNESEVYCVDIKLSISSSVGLITSRNLKKKKEIVLGQISHIWVYVCSMYTYIYVYVSIYNDFLLSYLVTYLGFLYNYINFVHFIFQGLGNLN